MSPGTVVVVLLVLGWLLQLGLAHRQARVFMHEVRQLQGRGNTAIGVAGKGWGRPKTYVAVAAGADGRVRAARQLSGLTVWARSKERPDLQGHALTELVDTADSGHAEEAAAMAARTLLESTPSPLSAQPPISGSGEGVETQAGTAADERGAAEASS